MSCLCDRIGRLFNSLPVGAGITLTSDTIQSLIEGDGQPSAATATDAVTSEPTSWRERLWTVPEETRIGVRDLAEALGKSPSWVYRYTGPKSRGPRLPHRKFAGELVFIVREIREWVTEYEK